jgi:hypothetical protein
MSKYKPGEWVKVKGYEGEFQIYLYRAYEDTRISSGYIIGISEDTYDGNHSVFNKATRDEEWVRWIKKSPGSEKFMLHGVTYAWIEEEDIAGEPVSPLRKAEHIIKREIGLK